MYIQLIRFDTYLLNDVLFDFDYAVWHDNYHDTLATIILVPNIVRVHLYIRLFNYNIYNP